VSSLDCYRIRLNEELACDQLAMATSGQGAQSICGDAVRVVSPIVRAVGLKTSAASAGLNGETP